MVAVDRLTQYVVARALSPGSLVEMTHFVKHILLRHGAPRVLLSESARYLLSQLLGDGLAASFVAQKCIASYQLHTNGITERFNHILGDMLSSYVSSEHENWDFLLPYVTFECNSALQSTTQ